MKLPLPPNAQKPVATIETKPIVNDDFKSLMIAYADANRNLDDQKEMVSDTKETMGALKDSMREVAVNLGLGRGSNFNVEGAGKFSWTTQRGFRLPAANRHDFVQLLIERGETSLLTIGDANLKAWCQQVRDDEDPTDPTGFKLPSYIEQYEDNMVPRVALAKKKG